MYIALIVILIAAALAFLTWASADVGSNVYIHSICKGSNDKPIVSLTFDDGPHPEMTLKVLDVLKKYGVKANFFLIGENVEKYPELAKRIVQEGHVVANHSYRHSVSFTYSSFENVKFEMETCQNAILKVVGKNVLLFRPPFGVTNPNIGKACRKIGLTCIGWSIRSIDTVSRTPREKVVMKILRKLHNGAIILLHDRCDDADSLLEQVIVKIKNKGYDFATLDQLLDVKVYEND